ncbi:MAG: hypothetical protein JXA96_09650 [Sedimentisphaerales bacterium]|nr:hypothetical protein [Sedimentisphaerales bacterium]
MKTMRIIQTMFVFSLLFCVSCSSANENLSDERRETSDESVDSILEKLNKSTQELQSYQCQIEYKYVQPSVWDTQTLRKGVLYYSKSDNSESNGSGKGMSKLRVNFQTLQQDEDEEQKYEEQYIIVDGSSLPGTNDKYKGLWLIQLDYESKHCNYAQLARADEPNKPVDVFELISTKLPIVGFSKTDRLKEEFEIALVTRDSESPGGGGLIQVQLKVKPNSVYKDDYVQIDCVIDEKLNLPVKITAYSTEPEGETFKNKDKYEIKFINAKMNEKIDGKVFDFQISEDFGEPDIYTLEN